MDKKKILWAFLSVLIAVCTVWAVMAQSKSFSVDTLTGFLKEAHKGWMFLALLCMFGFIWFEGCALRRILCSLGYQTGYRSGTLYAGADVFFSAITPSASGGQPASAFFMLRNDIPGPVVTVTLLLNAMMHTLALVAVGFFNLLIRFEMVSDFTVISQIFIVIGCIVLFLLAFSFYLALRRERLLYGICIRFLEVLGKMHLVRNVDKKKQKLLDTMADYRRCSEMIAGQRKMILEVFFWNVMQRVAQFGVSFMAFKAIGYQLGTAVRIWLIQSLVSVGSNCVPIPGSMGVADYIMLDGFTSTIGAEQATYMELICRSISFYGCILVSIMIVLIGYFAKKKNG